MTKLIHKTHGFISALRGFFSPVARRLSSRQRASHPAFSISRRLFAHGLGLIFFTAFASLLVQLRGLIGADGITPAAQLLPLAKEQLGSAAYWNLPGVFWLDASNAALMGGCVCGIVLSLALACGLAPGLCSVLLWGLYLSYCSIGSPFLDFQWDSLLLETGLLAAIFLPWRFRPHWQAGSAWPTAGRWLLWWLIFRLMFESGLVKIASGDPTWRDLTAMSYHYETQPLPLWTAWYAHNAPMWAHKLETVATFVIELAVPFAILLPRRARHAAALLIAILQLGIIATGNFAFFNWLTILLCIPLLDDGFWPKRWRWLADAAAELHPGRAARPWRQWSASLVGVGIFLITAAPLVSLIRQSVHQLSGQPPKALGMLLDFSSSAFSLLDPAREAVAPLRSFNSYGLFAVMTTERPEIIVEGSDDGQIWKAYEFRWKPGDVRERPKLVEPHQPRLDWQMWFAALGSPRQNIWFLRFLQRLHEGSPDVLGLLASNPFPDKPPRYLRALLYDYRFTRSTDTAAWWQRELRGSYWPPQAGAQSAE